MQDKDLAKMIKTVRESISGVELEKDLVWIDGQLGGGGGEGGWGRRLQGSGYDGGGIDKNQAG